MDFGNTKIAFAHLSDKELKRTYWVFGMMNNFPVQKICMFIPHFLISFYPFKAIIKRTIFKQFVGGETLPEAMTCIQKLHSFAVGTILDYGVEAGKTDEDFDAACQTILSTIHYDFGKPKAVQWITVKPTALLPSVSLLHLSQQLNGNILDNLSKHESLFADPAIQKGWKRILKIADTCQKNNMAMMIDAEESWLQDGIDCMATLLMKKYNSDKHTVVANTFQLYRKDRLAFLIACTDFAKANRFQLGAKIVRGAYMEKESAYAYKNKLENPICRTKAETDISFNSAMMHCLKNIEHVHPIIATHNEHSVMMACDFIEKETNPKKLKGKVLFSQLLGMSEHISFNLAHHGFKVDKYVPYGNVQSVFKYLMRRASENSSFKGQASREFSIVKKEVKRREK